MEFPNLGLLVIDEEQKFGVNQKEKLKVSESVVTRRESDGSVNQKEILLSLVGHGEQRVVVF